jgi:hypothetical protein
MRNYFTHNSPDPTPPHTQDDALRHHSGTQRRPKRDCYRSEAEYAAAYQRWRQVRDRNNDAVRSLVRPALISQVKRSREKYKAKKRVESTDAPRELQLECELETLKAKLALMARAYCRHPLSVSENAFVRNIVSEFAA